MKHKVLAYLTRQRNGTMQLLVFKHRDFPEAGVQIPAGTVEPGETVEAALFREVAEESGVQNPVLVSKLAEHFEADWNQTRHIFHLLAPDDTPENWSHTVQGNGEDNGMVFEYYWVDLTDQATLAGNQHRWLSHLLATFA